MIITRGDGTFSMIAVAGGKDQKNPGPKEHSVKKRHRQTLAEAYFAKKRNLTKRELVRFDDEVIVIVNIASGIIVLRSNPNPQHVKIRKLLDRIGIVGIGSDSAIDIIHELLEMRIDALLRPGYTRGDVWGSELGKFLSRVLGEFFFGRSRDDDEPAIFPANAFLFEVGHPIYGNFVEFITFDGQAESRLPPLVFYSPREMGDAAFAEKVGETLNRTVASFPQGQPVEIERFIAAMVGNAAKLIREVRGSPFFECVYLDGMAAAQRDFKRVWQYVDVEAAIASLDAPPKS